jgi:hypothetical protein
VGKQSEDDQWKPTALLKTISSSGSVDAIMVTGVTSSILGYFPFMSVVFHTLSDLLDLSYTPLKENYLA